MSAKNIGIGNRQYYKMYIGNPHFTFLWGNCEIMYWKVENLKLYIGLAIGIGRYFWSIIGYQNIGWIPYRCIISINVKTESIPCCCRCGMIYSCNDNTDLFLFYTFFTLTSYVNNIISQYIRCNISIWQSTKHNIVAALVCTHFVSELWCYVFNLNICGLLPCEYWLNSFAVKLSTAMERVSLWDYWSSFSYELSILRAWRWSLLIIYTITFPLLLDSSDSFGMICKR